MQKVQRQFGKCLPRTADSSRVSVLLKDFHDADKMLTRVRGRKLRNISCFDKRLQTQSQIIDASKAWRDAWTSILTYQHRLVSEFENIYAPILGASELYNGPQDVEASQSILERTTKLREEYEDLKKDLLEEVNSVNEKMIRPLMDAKDYLQPMKKTIKKREDRKVRKQHSPVPKIPLS